jgi:hypothetical protein
MPTHDTVTRNAIADAVVDLVDAGSLNANGRCLIYTDNRISLLAVIELANPAFAAAVSGVAIGLSMPLSDALADASGAAAIFDVVDRDENVVFSGSVALSGADMTVPDTEIAQDDIVKIISLNYTAPP